MAMLVTDPALADRLIAERRAAGEDRYDEVWDGVYVTTPFPNPEHQDLATRLAGTFLQAVNFDPRVKVYTGVNVSDRETKWKQNFRIPDVAVYFPTTSASRLKNHWVG